MNPSQSNRLTLFTEDSLDPANHFLLQESSKGRKTKGSCGRSFRGWSQRLNLVGYWLKTYLESLPSPPMVSAKTWKVKATMSGYSVTKLSLLVPRTGDHGSSLLPTPTANDAKNNGAPSQRKRNSSALNVIAGGALNPEWVELVMGFPCGWTDIGTGEYQK